MGKTNVIRDFGAMTNSPDIFQRPPNQRSIGVPFSFQPMSPQTNSTRNHEPRHPARDVADQLFDNPGLPSTARHLDDPRAFRTSRQAVPLAATQRSVSCIATVARCCRGSTSQGPDQEARFCDKPHARPTCDPEQHVITCRPNCGHLSPSLLVLFVTSWQSPASQRLAGILLLLPMAYGMSSHFAPQRNNLRLIPQSSDTCVCRKKRLTCGNSSASAQQRMARRPSRLSRSTPARHGPLQSCAALLLLSQGG